MAAPIPVVLDTDIGSDIDDAWALALLLRSPELDLKLVTTVIGDTRRRARLAAKLLAVAGRDDVPVAAGEHHCDQKLTHAAWADDYSLAGHRGGVRDDGAAAMVETIMRLPPPVTLLAIGPLSNVAAALRLEPAIAPRCRFVGMHGSVGRGYNDDPTPCPEWNVQADPAACRAAFAADWAQAVITPLDTCGLVRLTGEKFDRVGRSGDPLTRAVLANYDLWLAGREANRASSVLFDTVAVYLAFARDLVRIEPMALAVDEAGMTTPSADGRPIDVAVAWRDLPAFEDLLVGRLT